MLRIGIRAHGIVWGYSLALVMGAGQAGAQPSDEAVLAIEPGQGPPRASMPATASAAAPTSARPAPTSVEPSEVTPALRAAWHATQAHRCVVCQVRQGEVQYSELHKGTLVPVCVYCVEPYRSTPEPYFARLQPRAALFHDDYALHAPTRWFAFAAGCYALVGVLCAGIAGSTAVRKGHPAWPFVIGGFVGNVVAIVWARSLPVQHHLFPPGGLAKIPTTRLPTMCPGCGVPIHPAAKQCASCGGALAPTAPSEVDSARSV